MACVPVVATVRRVLPGAKSEDVALTANDIWRKFGPWWTRPTVNEAIAELIAHGECICEIRDDQKRGFRLSAIGALVLSKKG